MANVAQIITENILNKMKEAEEQGKTFRWVKPFALGAPDKAYSYNTMEAYRGINRILLDNNEYLTFNMVKALNEKKDAPQYQIRKGARGNIVCYYNTKTVLDEETGEPMLDKDGKVDRIFEKLGLVPENVADVYPEKVQEKDAPERASKEKSEADKFLDEVMAKPNPTKEEPHIVNPTEARTAKPSQSVPFSKNSPDSKDRSADERTLAERRPSVRKELKEIREEMDREKKTKGKSKNSPNKTAEHKAPPKKKKSKER